ncbi:MAG: hypothetical protein ACRDYX_04840 [Egibacteraceae bacterium]
MVSTAPSDVNLRRIRHFRTLRRLFFVSLSALLLLGMLNVYGVRTAEVSGNAGGYELTVRYASVTRPGLATPWAVQVRRAGGFEGPITIASTDAYFDLFDENGLDPDPAKATSDGERIIWQFEAPEASEVLTISFDARIEPGQQLRRVAATTAILDRGAPAVSVDYQTFVMP